VPPLVVILLNNVLLYLIDYSAQWEKHTTHSAYQRSVLSKCHVYLGLNMLVIPAATLSTSDSILNLFVQKQGNVAEILAGFMTNTNGLFFVAIILQSTFVTAFMGLIRPGDIIDAFFSPWLANIKRKYLNDSEPWRRHQGYVFMYGYFSACVLIIFSIVIVFAPSVPMVSIVAIPYFVLKHAVDCFNLLTVHKKEIESTGGLFHRLLLLVQLPLYLLQTTTLCSLIQQNNQAPAFALLFLFTLTLFYTLITNKSLVDYSKMNT